jgi:hypothetical protein
MIFNNTGIIEIVMTAKLNERQKFILSHLQIAKSSVSQIADLMNHASRATLNRDLLKLESLGLIYKEGRARATLSVLNKSSALLLPIDPDSYFADDIDERKIITNFNMDIFETLKSVPTFFSESELQYLKQLNEIYQSNYLKANKSIRDKELERFTIELSWKSSKIEGNTYSILDTETLIKSHKRAKGKSEEEAKMILNHKAAFDFIFQDPKYFTHWTLIKLTELHGLLTEGLDNQWQIKEALNKFITLINSFSSGLDKALLCLSILAYIQVFEDGNKRTSRLAANACLLADNYCPLSFRSINEDEYKKAVLLFYEQNNLSYLKTLFIEQFKFACENYLS